MVESFLFRDYSERNVSWRGVDKIWLGDRLVYDTTGTGAWPKPLIDPPAGWDERDAKGV